jgi:hypothetical protein
MKNIQLCHIDPINRAEDKFTVTAHSDDGNAHVTFLCIGEHNALKLRDAIRQYAEKVRNVADYRREK